MQSSVLIIRRGEKNMDELYVVVLEISAESDGYYVREKINEKVIMDSPVHRYDGFEFRIFVEKKNQKYF